MRIASAVSPGVELGLRQGAEAKLVERVRSVRDELAKENLLVAVEGVDHQVKDLAHLGLKGVGDGFFGHFSLLQSIKGYRASS